MTGATMAFVIQFSLSALLLSTVQASRQDHGPQTFHPPRPQYAQAQRYKEVVVYLTPDQFRNYEAGRGLPNSPQASSFNEQQIPPQTSASFAYEQEKSQQATPSYPYKQENASQATPSSYFEQQKPEPETPINEEEGEEANKRQFQPSQQNDSKIKITKTGDFQNSDIRPLEEQNTEDEKPVKFQPSLKQQQQQEQQIYNKLKEKANKEQEQLEKSYTYIHFFSNQKPENPQKIEIFHPEPYTVNGNDETRLQKEKNIEIQRNPQKNQNYKVPYEYITEQNIQQQVRDYLIKQGEKQVQQQSSVPAREQLQSNKERQNQQREYQQQNAPQFNNPSNNIDIGKIIQEIEKNAAKINADNIAKSLSDIQEESIINRRPVNVTKTVNIPSVSKPVEVKVPQPYAVPIEIIRRIPVPIEKTEAVKVEKPLSYEVKEHLPEFIEKKIYVPVGKPYTVERIVPVEEKKEIPLESPIHKPEKFTVTGHIWNH